MKKQSLWLDGIETSICPSLKEDIDVDILIIGGGITGVSTAYHLRGSNLRICLVDQDLIGHGVTSKTTGKLTYLQELVYSDLVEEHSKETAKQYYESQKQAIDLIGQIIADNNIKCDYQKVDSYIFTDQLSGIEKIKKEKKFLLEFGAEVKEYNELPIGIKSYCAIKVEDTAVFHPLKYLNALKEILINNNINIYERTKIKELKKETGGYVCFTNKNKIKAKKVVLACHYPFSLLPFFFPLKGYLERSYVSASKINDNKRVSIINVDKETKSIRYHMNGNDNYFIYLNGSHNLDTKYNVNENFNCLLRDLEKFNLQPKYIWSNFDIITNDSLPYIGYIDDNLIIGTGYNTWGMTNGSLAGKVISDLILEKENKYISLFDPKRCKGTQNIFSVLRDMYSSAKPFIENKIIKNKSFYSENVRFERINGVSVGIYKDNKGKEHIVYNKCPHLKCSLIFNEVEKTWDCPCHGSRFDVDGNSIQGPSSYDISYKEQ